MKEDFKHAVEVVDNLEIQPVFDARFTRMPAFFP
jgi:hypothetical protein